MTLPLTRRDYLKLAATGVLGGSMSGWLETMANETATHPQRKRSCILLWMNGGPSTIDLWDLKPGHANGGPYKEIATSVPGIKIGEHLPKLAQRMEHLAILRSMSTKEADHGRATFLMRTGYLPGGPIHYPSLGALVSKELERPNAEMPGFVSIATNRALSPEAFGSGFLGPLYAPLLVGENGNLNPQQPEQGIDQLLRVQNLGRPGDVAAARGDARVRLLEEMEEDFVKERPSVASEGHRTAYRRAVTLMQSSAVKAFNLSEEPKALRDAYGRNLFGQACLLSRRLVERGVPFIEVNLDGWDTHQQNFDEVKRLSTVLDTSWAMLLDDLQTRGLLDTTLIVWMGEFGRTPKINPQQRGRDHWATSWSTVLAGGGIKGGSVIGQTSADGMAVTERPVAVADLLATVGLALGIDIRTQNRSNVDRPIRFVDPKAEPVKEIIA
jgi:Protein of unknown function (DUF1501)